MDSGWNGVIGMSVLLLVVEAHKRRTEHVLDHTSEVYHVMGMKQKHKRVIHNLVQVQFKDFLQFVD